MRMGDTEVTVGFFAFFFLAAVAPAGASRRPVTEASMAMMRVTRRIEVLLSTLRGGA